MRKALSIVIMLLCMAFAAKAQELQCDVRVNASQVSGSDRTIYQNMQTALYEFVNNTKFTDINFRQNEKIECSILIDVKSREGENFTADISIALRRPVYKSNYNSPMFNYIDRKFNFEYMDGMTLDFNPNIYITDLTHTVGFYVYLMLGIDFDSFSPQGGTMFFDIAEQIVNSAPQTDGQPGWSNSGRNNRYAIINDINNPSYAPLRQFLYDYHRQGLDKMSEKPDEGREAMLGALVNLQNVYERNSMCYFLQLIVESKRDEIIQAFKQGNMKLRTEACNIMKTIDPSQSSRYDEMLQDKGM
jgi:hypothetical protein